MSKKTLAQLSKSLEKKTEKDLVLILQDLFTLAELDDFATRIEIFRHLEKGTPQREISQKLGVSISKITRGSNAIKMSKGGYKFFL